MKWIALLSMKQDVELCVLNSTAMPDVKMFQWQFVFIFEGSDNS